MTIEHDKKYMLATEAITRSGRWMQTRNAKCLKRNGFYIAYNLQYGFPLLLSKKVNPEVVFDELFWFNRGDTNANNLKSQIWAKWADENGELGPVYGEQWTAQVHTKIIRVSDVEKYQDAGYEDFGVACLNREQAELHFKCSIDELLSAGDYCSIVPIKTADGTETEEYEFPLMRLQVNQIEEALARLRANPGDRRAVVSAWNAGDLNLMALPPCHMVYLFMTMPMTASERYDHFITESAWSMIADRHESGSDISPDVYREFADIAAEEFSYYTRKEVDGEMVEVPIDEALDSAGAPRYFLDLAWLQRSNDWLVGVPFNVASYSLQLMLAAKELGMQPRTAHHFAGDMHIYEDQIAKLPQQLQQFDEIMSEDMEGNGDNLYYPRVVVKGDKKRMSEYTMEDIAVFNYKPKAFVKYPVTE